jgi:hypothetical protein
MQEAALFDGTPTGDLRAPSNRAFCAPMIGLTSLPGDRQPFDHAAFAVALIEAQSLYSLDCGLVHTGGPKTKLPTSP